MFINYVYKLKFIFLSTKKFKNKSDHTTYLYILPSQRHPKNQLPDIIGFLSWEANKQPCVDSSSL